MQLFTGKALWGAAAQWGSFIAAGDPGACMYGFDERGTVQTEEHRKACLAYLDETANGYPWSKSDLRHLRRTRASIAAAPCS